jgi:Arc/MetJ-type ribon-helix-helix transcriptional regulator
MTTNTSKNETFRNITSPLAADSLYTAASHQVEYSALSCLSLPIGYYAHSPLCCQISASPKAPAIFLADLSDPGAGAVRRTGLRYNHVKKWLGVMPMNRTESTYSERVGARISPELKEGLRELVEAGVFESEADAVRAALWQYVEQNAGKAPPRPARAPAAEADETNREWLMSALFVLVALVGSRILNALRREPITPAELADEALQETIYNHRLLHRKLAAARRIAQQADVD